MSNPYELPDAPSDIISSVQFSPDGSRILVGSWDQRVSIYSKQDGGTFSLQHRFLSQAPVLHVCWDDQGKNIFWVGLDSDVRKLEVRDDSTSSQQVILSSHEEASNKVAFSAQHGILLSTSWDGTMHVHNPHTGAFVRIRLAAKPFALSLSSARAVVAMAERKVAVYDLIALKQLLEQNGGTTSDQTIHEVQPWQERESSLKFMTRAIECMPDGEGFATSSIEGRVGVEWFDPDFNNDNKYAFKCHRQTTKTVDQDGAEKDVDIVYPVNALAFHPVHGTFATGGGDGVVALWDAKTKRRVRQYQKLGASVAAMDFSPDGRSLVVGISPGFEDGSEDEEVDRSLIRVVVREFAEGEAKARAAK
ncbi:nuclear pore complex subunit [Neohortaea acidophila]|uniref:Nuclear pore complex subunit n=1 Tax=Neohortaea acidophila TaxID=245834 RepID=A0A6A6PTF1_9PEZI|nr:nuclear pore complex subunit [Neohortaea acidophila]KAF2482954.1 nuclear pore complex subunit [Neohortaea acidophila]